MGLVDKTTPPPNPDIHRKRPPHPHCHMHPGAAPQHQHQLGLSPKGGQVLWRGTMRALEGNNAQA